MSPDEFKKCCDEHFSYLLKLGFRIEPEITEREPSWRRTFATPLVRLTIASVSYGANVYATITRISRKPDERQVIYPVDKLVRLRDRRFRNQRYKDYRPARNGLESLICD